MSQCPLCNTELTQAEVESGSCPSCGTSLLSGDKTQERDAKAPLDDEQLRSTDTVAEAAGSDGSDLMKDEAAAGQTFSLRDFSPEDLELYRQTISDLDESLFEDLELNLEEVDDEINNTSMAGMLDLRYVFELVIDSLDDRSFSEHELVSNGYQSIPHVLTNRSDKL